MQIHLVQATGLRKVLLSSICLVIATFGADRLASHYLDKIGHIATWNSAIHYFDTAAAVFLVIEMIVVFAAFRIGRHTINVDCVKKLVRPTSIGSVLWGLFAGALVSVAAFPLLTFFDKDVQFVRLLIDDPVSFQTILLACLLGALVPVGTEVVFRGIIFDVLSRRINALLALILSSFLFAYVWSPFDAGVALLLGLTCGLLYRRFNNLAPGIICSAVVTVSAMLFLFFRLLVRA